jgi:hypothetical protein
MKSEDNLFPMMMGMLGLVFGSSLMNVPNSTTKLIGFLVVAVSVTFVLLGAVRRRRRQRPTQSE